MWTFLRNRLSGLRNFIWASKILRAKLDAITIQLERIEDKISRIEDGLEANGTLTRQSRLKQRHLDPAKLSLDQSFDYIYLHGLWKGDRTTPSGSGSSGPWADQFVAIAKDLIRKHEIRSITDVGCGDFNVGSQICPLVERYHALDISGEIIRYNTERFGHLKQVTFQKANGCIDPLPRADLAIVRQVLQHLTNAQIKSLLENLVLTGFRFVLVAEHQTLESALVTPNLDLVSQSKATRFEMGSGVYLDRPPFKMDAQRIAQIEGEGGQLGIYLLDLSAQANKSVATA